MSQAFLNKVTPYLNDDEILVRDFASFMLHEFPYTPSEIVNQQLTSALHAEPKERNSILVWGHEKNVNDESLPVLLDLLKKVPSTHRHLVLQYVMNLSAQTIVDHAVEFQTYIGEEYIQFCRFLLLGDEKSLMEAYVEIVKNIEGNSFNPLEFQKAKKLQDVLIEKGYYGEQEVAAILKHEMQDDLFSINGVLGVRAVGVLQLSEYILTLASLLARDEDILLEEVAIALSKFQSDEVVNAVASFAMKAETFIYAVGILQETKTKRAEEVLIESYSKLDDDGKELVIEALAAHFTEAAFPIIEDFLENEYFGGMIDLEQTLYSFYKIMGRTHPEMEHWKTVALEIEEQNELSTNKSVPAISQKIGRNDPCPCGSEKKYKKCCGQAS